MQLAKPDPVAQVQHPFSYIVSERMKFLRRADARIGYFVRARWRSKCHLHFAKLSMTCVDVPANEECRHEQFQT